MEANAQSQRLVDCLSGIVDLDIAERQLANVATYQLITLDANAGGRHLRYRAYARDGALVDSFDAIK